MIGVTRDGCAVAGQCRLRGVVQLRRRRRVGDAGGVARQRGSDVGDEPPGLRSAGRRAADPEHPGVTRDHVDVLRPGLHRDCATRMSFAAIVAAGHEIAHHGYLHEAMAGLTAEQEAAILDRGSRRLEQVAGARPTGYRAPMWELNWHSPKLLRDRGFLYDSSLMDADHPYELAVRWRCDRWWRSRSSGHSTTGSSTASCRTSRAAGSSRARRRPREMWRLEFDAMRRSGRLLGVDQPPVPVGSPVAGGRAGRR